MNFPLYQSGSFDYQTGMAIAVVLGFFFGFALERGGFSRATILAAQFYGRDNRVFKVMFTAIVTATVGLGVLGGFGMVDLALVQVPDTNYMPLAAGGFLLGVGFIVSGYCPGTAVVGMASGSRDAAMSLVGMVLGTLVFGFSWDWIESFYIGHDQGTVRLTELFGLSWPIVAAGVLALALGGFWAAESLERVLAKKDKTDQPDSDPRPKRRVFAILATAAAVGLVSTAFSSEVAEAQEKKVARIEAVELSARLVTAPRSLWVVDLRTEKACAKKRVPTALCLPAADKEGKFISELPPNRTLVLYSTRGELTLPKAVHNYGGTVLVLDGGFESFVSDVLTAPKAPPEGNSGAFEQYSRRLALYNHFSGKPSKAPEKRVAPQAVKRAVRKGGGC